MRVLKFTAQYQATLKSAKLGPEFQGALKRCIQTLAGSPVLPAPHDLKVLIPPVGIVEWVRCIPGTGNSIWLYYKVVGDEVRIMRVTRNAPVRPYDP